MGFATTPFDASITLTLRGAPLLSWAAGASHTVDHTGYAATARDGRRALRLDADTAARVGVDQVALDGASVTLQRGDRAVTLPATCGEEVRFATPRDYLLGLVPR